ncbi:MAG: hypothetical protein R3331_11170 [Sulfurospirillaceae bacterium]|nr:hypothetical protein [Sulfurospirillaceae bacterium]
MSTVKYLSSFEIQQPAEVLFPLFSAEGEKLWVPGWDYENVTGTNGPYEDYIFLTNTHDHGSTKAIWLVKRYEPETFFIQFYKVEPEDKVGVITVRCIPLSDDLTKVEVIYKYKGLSEKGDEFIDNFTSKQYKSFISEWESLLIDYFAKNTDKRSR